MTMIAAIMIATTLQILMKNTQGHIHLVGRPRKHTKKMYKYKEKYTQANTFLRPDRRPSPPQEYY